MPFTFWWDLDLSFSFQERERLTKDFPSTDFKDEEYLLELMANNEEKDLSEEDCVMNALNRHANRTKVHAINKENEETTHPNNEETPTNTNQEA